MYSCTYFLLRRPVVCWNPENDNQETLFFFLLFLGQRRHPERIAPSVFRQGRRVRRHPSPDSVWTPRRAQAQARIFRVSYKKQFIHSGTRIDPSAWSVNVLVGKIGSFQHCCAVVFFFPSSSLKEFLPKEYIKQRGAEKKVFQVRCAFQLFVTQINMMITNWQQVFGSWMLVSSDLQEHKNCGEMTEIEAKVKYVKLARSLRTYGVSFFLVKVRYCKNGKKENCLYIVKRK